MDTDTCTDVVETAGRAFAHDLGRLAPNTPVPTCPGWVVRDLALHLGDVHRRIRRYVVEQRHERIPSDPAELAQVTDAELPTWFRTGVDQLVQGLRSAPPELDCYVLYPAAQPRHMWARRMAHETAVHDLDLAAAAGRDRRLSVEVAVDGIDEVLTGIARPGHRPTAPAPFATLIAPDDAGERWLVQTGTEGDYRVVRDEGAADLRLSGPAELLYRLLWNRSDASEVRIEGDAGLVSHWRDWHI